MSAAPRRVPVPKNGVDYRGKVVLAPMVRSGELPSRLVALKYGADLVWETVDKSLIGSAMRRNPRASTIEFTRSPSHGVKNGGHSEGVKESVIYRIYPDRESSHLIFQLGTASPTLAVEAARLVAPYVAGIDVNAGCPKPFSTGGGMGAALLSTPDLLCSILRELVKEIGEKFEIGISVKIRLLRTPEETRTLVEQLCATGITGLTIHCRTRNMRKTERAIRDQLRMVGDICRDAGVACVMNGDVADRTQAVELMKDFGVDGSMLASAAEQDPSVFRREDDGGRAPWHEVVAEYMKEALHVENRWGNTKFTLAQITPGKEQKKRGVGQFKNYAHACELLDLDELVVKAKELDALLGITERETRAGQKSKANSMTRDDSSCTKSAKRQRQASGQENVTPNASHGTHYHQDLQHDLVAAINTA
ncbi:MAG: hypothetical protein M1828_001103 [Chrysothrix sp. TS-e1954]|nr:MAG: hypothetical protein M1828_001103 [Chrysothrix sp. TS-e1954]